MLKTNMIPGPSTIIIPLSSTSYSRRALWDAVITEKHKDSGGAQLPDAAMLKRLLRALSATILAPGSWEHAFALDNTKTLSHEQVMQRMDLMHAKFSQYWSARVLLMDCFDTSSQILWDARIACVGKVHRQMKEILMMRDQERELLKLIQWQKEDKLIELLDCGQLDAANALASIRHRPVPKLTRTQINRPDVFEEPFIDGHLQDTEVTAFPDTGAAANFISLPYAQRHGLTVDENFKKRVKVGDGSTIRVVGTTTLPFSFAGETTKHDLTFHVLRKSVHDVILGSSFLRASETLTRFAHRVGRMIRKAVSPGIHRLCFLGSQQYVSGQANGVHVDAVPDTGADVSVMSARFAEANGFEIDDDEQHRISLGFADGSTARARGVVKGVAWRFGADEQTHLTDVYVLPNLPVDMVLGYEFLCKTEAFVEHEHDFWNVEDLERGDVWMLCLIRVLKRAMKGDGGGLSSNTEEERWPLAKSVEMALYRKAKEVADERGLSGDERTRYLQPHVDRWHQFLATWPGHSTGMLNMSPSPPSSGFTASSHVGGAQLQVQSHVSLGGGSIPMGKFSMGWFRRKARRNTATTIAVRT